MKRNKINGTVLTHAESMLFTSEIGVNLWTSKNYNIFILCEKVLLILAMHLLSLLVQYFFWFKTLWNTERLSYEFNFFPEERKYRTVWIIETSYRNTKWLVSHGNSWLLNDFKYIIRKLAHYHLKAFVFTGLHRSTL